MANSNQQQCDLFLGTLFAGYPDDLEVEFRGLRTDGRHPWRGRSKVGAPGVQVEGLSRECDLYVGVLPRAIQKSGHDQFTHANWLWADFDLKVAPEEKIKEACEHAEVVVASGGGYHAYWRLSETMVFYNQDQRDQFQRALKKFQQNLLPGCDPVHDLARILRVPGSINHKYGTVVELVRCPGMERVF